MPDGSTFTDAPTGGFQAESVQAEDRRHELLRPASGRAAGLPLTILAVSAWHYRFFKKNSIRHPFLYENNRQADIII
jgi:hypothetical protein